MGRDPGQKSTIDPIDLTGHWIRKSRATDESYNVLSEKLDALRQTLLMVLHCPTQSISDSVHELVVYTH